MSPWNNSRSPIRAGKNAVCQAVFKDVLSAIAHRASAFSELEPLVPKQKVGIVPVPLLGVALVAQRLHVVYVIPAPHVDRYYVINVHSCLCG